MGPVSSRTPQGVGTHFSMTAPVAPNCINNFNIIALILLSTSLLSMLRRLKFAVDTENDMMCGKNLSKK